MTSTMPFSVLISSQNLSNDTFLAHCDDVFKVKCTGNSCEEKCVFNFPRMIWLLWSGQWSLQAIQKGICIQSISSVWHGRRNGDEATNIPKGPIENERLLHIRRRPRCSFFRLFEFPLGYGTTTIHFTVGPILLHQFSEDLSTYNLNSNFLIKPILFRTY